MNYSVIPEPGSKLGPCKIPCAHADCAESRRDSEWMCHYCAKPIGYSTPFLRDPFTRMFTLARAAIAKAEGINPARSAP